MRKFTYFEKVIGCSGHYFACSVSVKKSERLLFKMGKDVTAHVSFYKNSKKMAKIGNEPLGCLADEMAQNDKCNYCKKLFEGFLWKTGIIAYEVIYYVA